jgi:nucleotide-binding universal stress UspA family protein
MPPLQEEIPVMQLKEKPAPLQLEDILVVTEFPPWADAAVPYALTLAREHRARMHVAHAASPHFLRKVASLPGDGGFRQSWRDTMLAATARQVLLDTEEIAPQLRAMMARHDFDLAVVSTGQEGIGEPSLGKAVKELLNTADCPVVVFGPGVAASEPPRSEPATILYATDFSPQALAAAQHAFDWAQEYQAWLTMLHVVEGIGPCPDHERMRLEKLYRKWMEELVPEEVPLWCEVDHRVLFGTAGSAIAESARELQADLIVLGLSGLDGAEAATPGRTVRQVIHEASCPVLVVREYMARRAPLEFARDRRSRAPVTIAA